MSSLLTPIKALPGMRSDIATRFASLGLQTLQDALFHFPIRHQDWRQLVPIDRVYDGQSVTILGTIVSVKGRRAWHRRKLHLTEVTVTDDSGAKLLVIWFNQPYLDKWLKAKQQWFLSSRITAKNGKLQLVNPMYERPGARPAHQTLVPVYSATAGLSQWQIRKVMKQAVAYCSLIPDPLPAEAKSAHDLMDLPAALQQIHFPTDPEQAAAAVRRLKLDELLAWQIRWQQADIERRQHPAPVLPFNESAIRQFVQTLPFKLTNDQRVAAWEIFQDLGQAPGMNRLVQGDVGSGKTVVAAMAAVQVCRAGWQVALVAPTVVLAEQHFRTLTQLLAPTDMTVGLLTGETVMTNRQAPMKKAELLDGLSAGELALLVTTHAGLQPIVRFRQLGLAIIDEQQRFGVDQRRTLTERQIAGGQPAPHYLSLTATPIPRTLALFFTGQLSISTIRQKPPDRLPITSSVAGPDERDRIDQAIIQTVDRGEQVYIITPLIEESDALGVRAATVEYDRVKKQWPNFRVGLLHGSLPGEERVATLEKFRRHELDILVSTTVIEVGVDVPNATLMVIEGAERFGLSQLHQLRGRIGRGSKPSHCYFVTDQPSPVVMSRLRRVAKENDGFVLAELDLELRGAGDIYGVRQSGLPEWRLASLSDLDLMKLAQDFVQQAATQPRAWPLLTDWATAKDKSSWHPE